MRILFIRFLRHVGGSINKKEVDRYRSNNAGNQKELIISYVRYDGWINSVEEAFSPPVIGH
jgi:hypothetical protein